MPDSTVAVGIFVFAVLRVLGSGLNVEVSHLVISHIVMSRSHRPHMVSRSASLPVSRFHLLHFVRFLCPVFCSRLYEKSLPQNTDFRAIVASVLGVEIVQLSRPRPTGAYK
jgi:hypothetical protein